MLKPQSLTRVLIVEDEPRLREMLAEGIEDIGFRVQACRSAEDALLSMDQERSDIAILDLNLPNMDGLECFERINRRWPEVAVVILTGFGTLAAAQQAIRLGVVEFLTKPVSLGDLERALHHAWRRCAESTEPAGAVSHRPPEPQHAGTSTNHPRALRDLERQTIMETLARHGGNRKAAALELGVSERKLYYRLSQYGLTHSRERG